MLIVWGLVRFRTFEAIHFMIDLNLFELFIVMLSGAQVSVHYGRSQVASAAGDLPDFGSGVGQAPGVRRASALVCRKTPTYAGDQGQSHCPGSATSFLTLLLAAGFKVRLRSWMFEIRWMYSHSPPLWQIISFNVCNTMSTIYHVDCGSK